MADNSPSVELAPLKGSIILDLDQFDEDYDRVEDKIVSLAELFHIALNPHLNIDLNNFNDSLAEAQENVKKFENEIDGINKEIDIKINTDFEPLGEIKGLADEGGDVSTDEINKLYDPAQRESELAAEYNLYNIKQAAEAATEQVDDLKQALETVANRSEDTWSEAFGKQISENEDILDKFESTLNSEKQYLATGLEANEKLGSSLLKDENYDSKWDDIYLDPNFNGDSNALNGPYISNNNSSKEKEKEPFNLDEFGSHLLDRGMMLKWTIAPMIDAADKSIIQLGFSTEAAFNLANREFGKNSSIVQQWSKTTAESLGLSSSDALNLADRFGLSARSMGANKAQAAQLAENMTSLADQLSLATGGQISLSAAGQVLTGVMGGQMYGLKQLGITFSTSQQNAEAAALGYGKVYSKLTPLQQAYVNTALLQSSLNSSLGSLNENLGSNYGQWEQTKAQLQENAETMATDLLPSLIQLMHGVEHVVDWFSHLGKAGHLAAGAILLIATAVTPVMLVLGSLIKSVTVTYKIFSKLFGLFKKGAKDTEELGKAGEEAAEHSRGLLDVFKTIGRAVLDVSKTFIDWAADAISSVAEIVLALDPITLAIGAIVVAVIAAGVEIYEHWTAVKNFFIAMFKDLQQHFTELKNSLENTGKAIGSEIENIKNHIKNSIDYIINSIEHFGTSVLQAGDKLLNNIVHFGTSIFNSVERTIKDIFNAVVNNPVIHAVIEYDKAILNLITTSAKAIVDIVGSMFHFLLSWVIYYGEEIGEFIGKQADALAHIVEQLGESIKTSVTNFFDYVFNKVSSGLSYLESKLSNWFSWISGVLSRALNSAESAFENWCDWIGSEIEIPINAIKNMAEIMGQSMLYGIEYIVNVFKNGWSDLCAWFAYWVEIPAEKAAAGMDHLAHDVINGIHLAVNGFHNGWSDLCGWFDSAVEQPIISLENTAEQWFAAGENIIKSLLHGIENAFIGVTNYVTSKINSITSKISHAASDVTSWFDGHSADGSHATGLYNVPWDGYRAELHSGEMVLTKDQADQYRNGTGGANGGVNVTINSPRPLDPFEVKRQMEQYSRNLANGIY